MDQLKTQSGIAENSSETILNNNAQHRRKWNGITKPLKLVMQDSATSGKNLGTFRRWWRRNYQ
ncbi:MAG: hypothetical protein M9959_14055 [Chitinophagaceae bacterium]|nr:hypothetical protein [Chitinophagaceae bacterium]